MTDQLTVLLPEDIVTVIKLFTGEIVYRNGKFIKRIGSGDYRCEIMRRMPRIKQLHNSVVNDEQDWRGAVWFKTLDKKNHIVISVYYNAWHGRRVWEMNILDNGKRDIMLAY